MPTKKPLALVVTPSLKGGSWIAINELIKETVEDLRFIVIAYGKKTKSNPDIRYFTIPFPAYDKYGILINSNPFLNVLYSFPIILMGIIFALINRPRVFIANGILTSLSGVAVKPLIKSKILISYHGEIKHYTGNRIKKWVRLIVGNHVNLIQVNSEGSKVDASNIADPVKVRVIEHWANESFFEPIDRELLRKNLNYGDEFIILFVGRLDKEKYCSLLLNIAHYFEKYPNVKFQFVGNGVMKDEIKRCSSEKRNVFFQPYVSERKKLKEYYVAADLLWGYADETYLARPAIESLASGTPILVPNRPAVLKKAEKNIRIQKKIVPDEIGWLVDPDDFPSIIKLLEQIISEDLAGQEKRNKCVNYARKHYSTKNLQEKKSQLLDLVNAK